MTFTIAWTIACVVAMLCLMNYFDDRGSMWGLGAKFVIVGATVVVGFGGLAFYWLGAWLSK